MSEWAYRRIGVARLKHVAVRVAGRVALPRDQRCTFETRCRSCGGLRSRATGVAHSKHVAARVAVGLRFPRDQRCQVRKTSNKGGNLA